MGYKQIQAIPNDGDGDARAEAPNIVSQRKNHDRNVNECLEKMQKASCAPTNADTARAITKSTAPIGIHMRVHEGAAITTSEFIPTDTT